MWTKQERARYEYEYPMWTHTYKGDALVDLWLKRANENCGDMIPFKEVCRAIDADKYPQVTMRGYLTLTDKIPKAIGEGKDIEFILAWNLYEKVTGRQYSLYEAETIREQLQSMGFKKGFGHTEQDVFDAINILAEQYSQSSR